VVVRHWFDSVDSTQATAIAMARAGALPGCRVVADRQERGVGRGDHTWSSPVGGLYVSMILPRPPPEQEHLVTLSIGVGVRSALESQYGVPALLRWPNDLVVPAGRRPGKLAGVLVDRVFSIDHGPALVAGVGVNVHADRERFPAELRDRVVNLADLDPPGPSVREVEELVARATLSSVHRLATAEGGRDVVEECRKYLFGRGRRAVVDGALSGKIRDVADDGALWLEGPAGGVRVRAGSLSVEDRP
jgi:BirA family biotin operon repressor/biotin-[acetyl-CoA-carboxylase] ligase